MGRVGFPWYGEDLATVLEAAKKLIEKIESNKHTKTDLIELAHLNAEIIENAFKD